MPDRVLITGITGFIGAHLAEVFLSHGYEVGGLIREGSDRWRCLEFDERITWINTGRSGWRQEVSAFGPSLIIHGAWEGVSAKDRSDWTLQQQNLSLLFELLELAKIANTRQFIGLGSQAEYGYFDGAVDENFPCNPNSAYGVIKLMAKEAVKGFCEEAGIRWQWVRLFPCYGEKESFDWFIPMLVRRLAKGEVMDMTLGEQQYAYLYVKDLARWIFKMNTVEMPDGVYNLSSKHLYSLRTVVERIYRFMGRGQGTVHFGALPYRKNQPMMLRGITNKLKESLGELSESNFDQKLEGTVHYILNKFNQ